MEFDYNQWTAATLHPEDSQAFGELLGGTPTLEEIMMIEENHLIGITTPAPGGSTRIWSAISSLQALHHHQSETNDLKSKIALLEKQITDLKANPNPPLPRTEGTGGGKGVDTWENDFQRLEGVLKELQRMNADYPPAEGGQKDTFLKGGGPTLDSYTETVLPAASQAQDFPSPSSGPLEPTPKAEIEGVLKEQKEDKEDKKVAFKVADEEEEEDYSMFILGGDDGPSKTNEVDPADFMAKDLDGKTVIRNPGEINGQSFTLDNLKNCTIGLFDTTSQVTGDDLVDCRIFIGPCQDSVFLRGCSGCNVIVSCGQFRTRDCKDMNILIHCTRGQPIIESSSNLRIGPFDGSYEELPAQLSASNMSPWDTDWTGVYDFTPPQEGEASHWALLYNETAQSLMGEKLSNISGKILEGKIGNFIPRTWGDDGKAVGERWFVVLGGEDPAAIGYSMLSNLTDLTLVRSRVRQMNASEIEALGGGNLPEGKTIGCEVIGTDLGQKFAKALAGMKVLLFEKAASKKAATEYFGVFESMKH
ncbi:hypothetical protein AAMO2058_000725100 [Amorphochlora amoebiformis]